MFNTKKEAERSKVALRKSISLVPEVEKEAGRLRYKLAYNQNEFVPLQLLQVFRQKVGEKTEQFWRWVFGLEDAPSWFQSALRAAALGEFALVRSMTSDDDARAHLSAYQKTLADGWRIALVSHSQGNFYANFAASELVTKFHRRADAVGFGNVQVATPADEVVTGGPWSTFPDDAVIGFVRLSNRTPGSEWRRNLDPARLSSLAAVFLTLGLRLWVVDGDFIDRQTALTRSKDEGPSLKHWSSARERRKRSTSPHHRRGW